MGPSINVNDPHFTEALELALKVATPIAQTRAAEQANGEFLAILLKLLEQLLPVILQLFKG